MQKVEAMELSGAKASARDSINAAFCSLDRYSDYQKPHIASIVDTAMNALSSAISVDELLIIRDGAISEIAKIPSLLDEAKKLSIEKLDEVFESLKNDILCYSEAVWNEIKQIYDHTAAEIGLISSFEELDLPDAIANERCALMKNKKRDRLYTADKILANGSAVYPSDYNTQKNGYAGSISAIGRFSPDTTLSISPFSSPSAEDIIRKAIKGKRVTLPVGSTHGAAILRAIKGCKVITGIDISYSDYTEGEIGSYTVTLLLPDEINAQNLLGAVYIRNDGSIEFFECSLRERLMTFEIPHFSNFYLIEEKTVDLTPLIVILSVFLIAEGVIITLIILRKTARAKKNCTVASVLPLIPLSVLTKLLPSGALPITIILSLLVICAGGAIIYLALDEFKYTAEKAKKDTLNTNRKDSKNELVRSDKKELAPILSNEPQRDTAISLPTKKPDILDTVSVDEADSLMSDIEAKGVIESVSTAELPPAVFASHGKKYEVNIDAISEAFDADETVSLDSLKQKGLIPKSARAVKILARGSLNKPLTVIAQDFSTSAVKMITLTGGHAMLVERE